MKKTTLLLIFNMLGCTTTGDPFPRKIDADITADSDNDSDSDSDNNSGLDSDFDSDIEDNDRDADIDEDIDEELDEECTPAEGYGGISINDTPPCDFRTVLGYFIGDGDDRQLEVIGLSEELCCSQAITASEVWDEAFRTLRREEGQARDDDNGTEACEAWQQYYLTVEPYLFHTMGEVCHLTIWLVGHPYYLGEYGSPYAGFEYEGAAVIRLTHTDISPSDTIQNTLDSLKCEELTDIASFDELWEEIQDNNPSNTLGFYEGVITVSGSLEAPIITGEDLIFRNEDSELTTTGSLEIRPEICLDE